MDAREKQQKEMLTAHKVEMTALKEAHDKQLKALVDNLSKLGEAASIPSFTAFDPTSELWKDYRK